MKLISRDAMLRHARSIGLAEGKTFMVQSMEELTLAFDLAIYTAPADRSRAIDPYARSAPFAAGSDEALVLEAMRNARFGIVLAERRHPVAGLIVKDLFRNTELWLMDEGLETSTPEGATFVTRYATPDRFVTTTGVGIPIGGDLLTVALDSVPQLGRHKSRIDAIEDRRFAEAIYRTAIASGAMKGLRYQDASDAGNATLTAPR
jgi:hypothetical protein